MANSAIFIFHNPKISEIGNISPNLSDSFFNSPNPENGSFLEQTTLITAGVIDGTNRAGHDQQYCADTLQLE